MKRLLFTLILQRAHFFHTTLFPEEVRKFKRTIRKEQKFLPSPPDHSPLNFTRSDARNKQPLAISYAKKPPYSM